ncbi:MAG: hypothetical protein U0992_24195 [Planctomycetaceae bacterium]
MPSSQPRQLLAGVARAIITPPIGIRLLGYTVQEGCSRDVERELTATVLVLSDGDTSAVIIGLDLLWVPLPISDRMRAAIGRAIGVPGENVLLNGSHTHLGPMFPGWQDEESPQRELQARYAEFLEDVLVGAASTRARQIDSRRGCRTGRGSAPLR